jgi:hypothetical protein
MLPIERPPSGLEPCRRRLVAAALFDLDLHLDLAARREVRDRVLGIDDLDVVVGLDVGGRDRTFAGLRELQEHVVAIVQLHHDALQVAAGCRRRPPARRRAPSTRAARR